MKLTPTKLTLLLACTMSLLTAGCSKQADNDNAKSPKVTIDPNPYPSTYTPIEGQPTLITNVTILDGVGNRIENGSIYFADGKIQALAESGQTLEVPDETAVIDGTDKWVTPGIIDNHSHLGVYPSPSTRSHSDGNEMTNPVTAQVWAEHSVWPQDPGFGRALAGGVTSLQILPGSANLFGGRSVVLKLSLIHI